MLYTEDEKLISNLSYTEKDFQSIYPSLLDLVKKLSAKWDPSASNESDPGVLLLKLNAIIADKCNYNIDKNILECFPLSVTQNNNARQLYEQLGYYMHWYQAASTVVTFNWIGSTSDNSLNYKIPAFTMVCNEDKSIVYTTATTITLSDSGEAAGVLAYQGIVKTLSIDGDTKITASMLDSKNRIYITDTKIAQNAIFISNYDLENYDSWTQKTNLLLETISTTNKCYKFGVLSDMVTCYIEFPSNAEDIIQDGITIKYLVTDGIDGQIATNTLVQLYDTLVVEDPTATDGSTITLTTEEISINNYVTGGGGTDIETIDEAYKGYRSTVGTFDTLVTLRDYLNAVIKSGYVSNAIVSDRTTDVQSSYKIMSKFNDIDQQIVETVTSNDYDVEGYYYNNEFYTDSGHLNRIDPNLNLNYYDLATSLTYRVISRSGVKEYVQCDALERDELEAVDLKMYLLAASTAYNTDTHTPITFTGSFKLLTDNTTQSIIEAYLDDLKCSPHVFQDIRTNRICFIKEYYTISCKLVPQYKLDNAGIKSVISNAKTAIYNKLNASEVDFGVKIDYDTVYDILLNSDTRIKSVVLDTMKYIPRVVYLTKNDEEELVLNEVTIGDWILNSAGTSVDWTLIANTFMKEIFAKSVLAGRTQFFVKDSEFNYELDQKCVLYHTNVGRIKTNTAVTISKNSDWQYAVLDNEVIQFLAPNLISFASYSSNIKFEYHLDSTVTANANYTLGASEYIIFYWLDSENSSYSYAAYGEGTVISPSFNLTDSVELGALVGNCLLKNLVDYTPKNSGQTFKYATGNTDTDSILTIDLTSKVAAIVKTSQILSGSRSVTIKLENALEIDNTYQCYWVLNETENGYYILFDDENFTSRVLNSNEYFIYRKTNNSSYYIVGAGTELTRKNPISGDVIKCSAEIPLTEISDNPLTAISKYSAWIIIGTTNLKVIEQQSITLPSNSIVSIKPSSNVVILESDPDAEPNVKYELYTPTSPSTIIPGEETHQLIQADTSSTSPSWTTNEFLIYYTLIEDTDDYLTWNVTTDDWIAYTVKESGLEEANFYAEYTATQDRINNPGAIKYTGYVGYRCLNITEGSVTAYKNTIRIYFSSKPTTAIEVHLYCWQYKCVVLAPKSVLIATSEDETSTCNLTPSGLTSATIKTLIGYKLLVKDASVELEDAEYRETLSTYGYEISYTGIGNTFNKIIWDGYNSENSTYTLKSLVNNTYIHSSSPKNVPSISFDSNTCATLADYDIKYKLTSDASDWTVIPKMSLNSGDDSWKVFAYLHFNSSQSTPMVIHPNQSLLIEYWYKDNQHAVTSEDEDTEPYASNWDTYKPITIEPEEDTYLLSELTMDTTNHIISPLKVDYDSITEDEIKYDATTLYLYTMSELSTDIIKQDDGTIRAIFRGYVDTSLPQVRSKGIDFRLPSGNYILPLKHSTINTNLAGISLLNAYIVRNSLNEFNSSEYNHLISKFNTTIDIKSLFHLLPESNNDTNIRELAINFKTPNLPLSGYSNEWTEPTTFNKLKIIKDSATNIYTLFYNRQTTTATIYDAVYSSISGWVTTLGYDATYMEWVSNTWIANSDYKDWMKFNSGTLTTTFKDVIDIMSLYSLLPDEIDSTHKSITINYKYGNASYQRLIVEQVSEGSSYRLYYASLDSIPSQYVYTYIKNNNTWIGTWTEILGGSYKKLTWYSCEWFMCSGGIDWFKTYSNFETVYSTFTSDSDKPKELLTVMGSSEITNMYNAGYYYLKLKNINSDTDSNSIKLILLICYAKSYTVVTEVPAIVIELSKIFKYTDPDWITSSGYYLPDTVAADLSVKIYEEIKKLDVHSLFDYTYIVDSSEEISNPISAESFMDSNHIFNPYVICQALINTSYPSVLVSNVAR